MSAQLSDMKTGNAQLDSLIVEFADAPENDALRYSDYAQGRCDEASERFYDFLAENGLSDAGIDYHRGDHGAGIAAEVDHVWCWVRVPEGVFLIDWTAAQFDGDASLAATDPSDAPFPLVKQKIDGDYVELSVPRSD